MAFLFKCNAYVKCLHMSKLTAAILWLGAR